MPSLTNSLYEFGEFRVDVQSRVLRRGEEPIALTPKAFEVLALLIEHTGRIVSKDELMQTVWPDSFVEESNLTQTVFVLRKALGENPDQRYILTVPGRGYRFAADVKQVSEEVRVGAAALVRPPRTASGATQSRKTKSLALALGLVLIAGIIGYVRWFGPRPEPARPARMMLAVLPFQNLTGDAAQEYFSDGMTEEMITQMGRIDAQRMGVIGRTSAMHYKHSSQTVDQIGRELGVQYVLEGSVRRESGRVRITAQLVQVKDQTHLWAQEYDRELKDLLVLQGEIARTISAEIEIALGNDKPVQPPTQTDLSAHNYEAYDLYLKGQYFWNKRTTEGFQRAIDYFQQAIAKDPSYARAYAGLADSYALMGGYSAAPQTEFMPKARAAALKALEIDENLPEAHTALALIVQNYDWDWQTAEKEFRRAIELNRNYATAHHWYAEHLMWRGRFDEALQESERARQLDPLSLIIAADNGAILYFSRQYDRAIEKWRSVLEMDPDFPRAHLIGAAYVEKGMFAEALADLDAHGPMVNAPWYWGHLAYIYGRSGHNIQAQRALDELLRLNRRMPIDPQVIADAYAGLGDKDQALAWLEKAYAQHSTELTSLKVNPGYDFLRSDPRYQNLLRRVGLAS
jgi:TolB-like protein/DNA-binding winged helix-turn-helix (wHTH) protein/Tfp pilus assembly protein PilF